VTVQLAQRLALFLRGRGPQCLATFLRAKVAYGIRSGIAHGRRLVKKAHQGSSLLADSEGYLRDALLQIVLDPTLLSIFKSEVERDGYLRGLAFLDTSRSPLVNGSLKDDGDG
jgi:hypothetical protein